jgi:hypothetical protein
MIVTRVFAPLRIHEHPPEITQIALFVDLLQCLPSVFAGLEDVVRV